MYIRGSGITVELNAKETAQLIEELTLIETPWPTRGPLADQKRVTTRIIQKLLEEKEE